MKRRMVISIVLAALVAAAGVAIVWPDKKMISRDIGCSNVTQSRAKTLCQALSDSMEWTWMGHGIISPGWRATWNVLRNVYCRERIAAVDLPVLGHLKQRSDQRLQDGADGLIRLINSVSGQTEEPENSLFNPANPQYLLKGGCAGIGSGG
jgi:hypothetical protein